MKTDRELLELAARAAGLEGGYLFRAGGKSGTGFPYNIEGFQIVGGSMWNPLTSDGDAMRLAVKLGIDVDFCEKSVEVWRKDFYNFIREPYGEDALEATRRAIVRAAAEIAQRSK